MSTRNRAWIAVWGGVICLLAAILVGHNVSISKPEPEARVYPDTLTATLPWTQGAVVVNTASFHYSEDENTEGESDGWWLVDVAYLNKSDDYPTWVSGAPKVMYYRDDGTVGRCQPGDDWAMMAGLDDARTSTFAIQPGESVVKTVAVCPGLMTGTHIDRVIFVHA